MSSKIEQDRARFEKWRSEFYGPQNKFNPVRSLELHDAETGLGYVDQTVQAQFCAFQGAAPIVERQPILIQAVAVTREDDEEGLRLEWLLEGGISEMEFPGMMLFALPEANDLCDENGSAKIYTAPPELAELAELQATIVQLTAENERLELRNANQAKTIKQCLDTERLKGGQGEAVMKLEAERLWEGDGEYSVSFCKSGWLDECRKTGGEFLLYTSQPTPISVDEQSKFEEWYAEDIGLDASEVRSWRKVYDYLNQYERCRLAWAGWQARACLDKVKELNQ